MRIHNFSPGPAILPKTVLAEAAESLKSYKKTGLSIAEISHRSPVFLEIIEEATAIIKDLYSIKDDFEVLWMPGGASTQLAIAPMNFVNRNQSIAIAETGYWAKRTMGAAAQICKVDVLASSRSTGFDRIPTVKADKSGRSWALLPSTQYLHVVSNETIDGIQYHDYPSVSVPIVADMTSDFLTKPLPLEKFGLIFASAQKNFGMAGVTCVLIRKDMLTKTVKRTVPTIFNYKTHVENQSLYHTCPTFPIYTSMLALRWIRGEGGLVEMNRRNTQKANVLYAEIDRNPLFKGSVLPEFRSTMNACFKAISPEIEAKFITFAEKRGIVGIKGFPTVGGFRASMYNAMPLESVQFLVETMEAFSREYELTPKRKMVLEMSL